MRRTRIAALAACTLAVTAACGTGQDAAALTAATTSAQTWRLTFTAARPNQYLSYNTVAALGSKDVWSLGTANSPEVTSVPLARHWNGDSWARVALPSGLVGSIKSSYAASPTNVWAGVDGDQDGGEPTLLHWNGTTWSIAKQWNVYDDGGDLSGVTALSATNVWAYGPQNAGLGVWHYDGATWSQVSGSFGILAASALSASNIWAICDTASTSYICHYNGTSWSHVAATLSGDTLYNVLSINTSSVWAVGLHGYGANETPLLLHWNGKAWQTVSVPGHWGITSVARNGSGGIWLAGQSPYTTGSTVVLKDRSARGVYAVGKIAAWPAGTKPSISAIRYVPGTAHTMWAVGSIDPSNGGPTSAAIFSY
jgi:hypothetical protein